jgi:amphi-Trp domain-containing protein
VPNLEITRKTVLTRQQVADRLIAWGNALAAGSEVELESGDDSIKVTVADEIQWELEIEIDGDETEIEIELKWRDRPAPAKAVPARRTAAENAAKDVTEPIADAPAADPVPETPKPPARRGRPRKATS